MMVAAESFAHLLPSTTYNLELTIANCHVWAFCFCIAELRSQMVSN
jgi:hypothetical protein